MFSRRIFHLLVVIGGAVAGTTSGCATTDQSIGSSKDAMPGTPPPAPPAGNVVNQPVNIPTASTPGATRGP